MVSTQSKYDMEYVAGEFGDSYSIPVLNDDGSAADISAFTAAKLTIKKLDGTLLFNDTTNLTISTNSVAWVMQASETTALSYIGEARAQLELTNATKKRLVKKFTVFIYENQVD